MKFAHLADTHIRNLKYHDEYVEVFDRIFEILREEEVDYIIHCGDIGHTKTQISPEFVDMCIYFLKGLADIADTYIILGNHDGNLRNSNRQDAISPIVKALNHNGLHVLKNSGEYRLGFFDAARYQKVYEQKQANKELTAQDFTLNVLSVFDKDNWIDPTDPSKVNIALHHGSVRGCQTDSNWTMEYAENEVTIFENFDYAFLGDIHKTNQTLDDDGRCRYAGSTIQQNHGETNDKGFLIWDIKSKTDFEVKQFSIPNPKPFHSLKLTQKGQIPRRASVPYGARLRLISENNLPLDRVRKSIDIAKKKFSVESVTYLNKAENKRGNLDDLMGDFKKEDLRDKAVQERLIREFLKEYHLEDNVMQRVLDLNVKYNAEISAIQDVRRNIDFEILELEWDNLFNYGEGNKINFQNMQGIIGLFGKAYSGKSSALDALMFTIYNMIGKSNPGGKTLNIINRDSDWCRGFARLRIGNKEYTIERKAEKYIKKLHGEETTEAKMVLDFFEHDLATGETKSLNGERRQDTDKNIAKYFGHGEDFAITTMYHQFGTTAFIDAKSTERKKIFAKFLDLEPFEKKYKLANDGSKEKKAILKRLENVDYDTEIENAQLVLEEHEELAKEQKVRCSSIKEEIAELNKQINKLEMDIENAPAEYIDIKKLQNQIMKKSGELGTKTAELSHQKKLLEEKRASKEKVAAFLKNFDINSLVATGKEIAEKEESLQEIKAEQEEASLKVTRLRKKLTILDDVPCGDEYPSCPFIKDAHQAKKSVDNLVVLIRDKESAHVELYNDIMSKDPEKVTRDMQKYHEIYDAVKEIESEITIKEHTLSRMETELRLLANDIESLEKQEAFYEKNQAVIENLEGEMQKKTRLEKERDIQKEALEDCENQINALYKEHGSLEQKLNRLKEDQEELQKTRNEYEAYDLYLKCMHPSGIAYDIVKRSLPAINKELSTILTNIIDMDVYFENEGESLRIYFQRSCDSGPIPLELGSGTQKSLAAMAIRLALVNVSSLPRGDIFILDEPGTMLDADNMEGFIRILELVKSLYNRVILVSHLDPLKDTADSVISIDTKKGRAHINI